MNGSFVLLDEQTVTLTVSGVAVTGLLVSESEWFRQQRAFGSTSERAAALFPEEESAYEHTERQAGRHVEPERAYIHLKNERYVTGASLVPNEDGPFWRGRVESVGWTLDGLGLTERHV